VNADGRHRVSRGGAGDADEQEGGGQHDDAATGAAEHMSVNDHAWAEVKEIVGFRNECPDLH
jgi:hypothetical protein